MAFIISGSAGSVKVSEENKQTASAASCEEGTVIRIGNRLQAGERYSKKGCGNLPSRILFHSALFHQGAIQLDILVGGAAPAEIGAQAAIHQNRPIGFVRISAERTADGVQHVVGVVGLEGEAHALAVAAVADAVLQAAGFPHDGNRAIPAGHHLRQAAGLALGGHKEDIRAGVYLPGPALAGSPRSNRISADSGPAPPGNSSHRPSRPIPG